MAKRIVGLDVGSYSIKVVTIESTGRAQDQGSFKYSEKILGKAPSSEEEDSSLIARQIDALKALREEGALDGDIFVTGLSGKDAQLRSFPLPFTDPKKVNAVLAGMLDEQTAMNVDDLLLTWSIQSGSTEHGAGGTENLYAAQLALAKKEAVAAHLQFLSDAGVDPRLVTLKSVALFDLMQGMLKKDDRYRQFFVQEGNVKNLYLIVDIGHQDTNILIADTGHIRMGRSVLKGGKDIISAVAAKLAIPYEEAAQKIIVEKLFDSDEEILQHAYEPIVRDLRQTILSINSQGVGKIVHIFLVGGSSRPKNLAAHFEKALHVPCHGIIEFALRGSAARPSAEAALAISYALAGLDPARKENRFNFRIGDFAFRSDLGVIRARIPVLVAWSLVVILSLVSYGLIVTTTLSTRLHEVSAKQSAACERILQKKTTSPAQCLSLLQQEMAGQKSVGIPKKSAVDAYLELPKLFPTDLHLVITDLDLSEKKIAFSAETDDFVQVDNIVEKLQKGPCFTNVKKGTVRKKENNVAFQITVDIDCAPEPEPAKTTTQSTKAKG